MLGSAQNKVEKYLRYEIKQWKIKGSYDIINDFRENITLVKLMEKIGNMNHAVRIVGKRIFDSNYKKDLHWKNNN